MDKIVALVLTYNRIQLLQECIEVLKKQTASCDILIVDNASTDGTPNMMLSYVKNSNNIDYVNTGKNLGGAGGFSFGIRECVKRGYDYIWLMDDDTIPYPTALERLICAKNDLQSDFGFLSSLVEWTDGSMCEMNMPLVADDWWSYGNLIQQGRLAIKKGSFVSFFVPASIVREVGLPIKEFFIWFDDSEYSRRIVEKGHMGYLVSDSRVLHKMGSNSKVDIVVEGSERLQRYRMAFRNRYYMNKGRGFRTLVKYYIFLITTILSVLKNSKNKKYTRIKIILLGTLDGIRFSPDIDYIGKIGDRA